jgi:hypothetical protein
MGRDQRIAAEAAALWQALYGEPPPLMTDGVTMLDVALRSLPDMTYERLRAEQLRPGDITFPR